jgi:uracil-DNA glycosylase family protein
MRSEVARSSICLRLYYTANGLAFISAGHQQFADTLAGDVEDRLRVEVAGQLQTAFSVSACVGTGSVFKITMATNPIQSAMAHTKNGKSPADLIRPEASLSDLWKAAQECRGCDIWERATQAVLGKGGPGAEVMMVGEQPGDREDIEGHPFVGPAGKLLDRALVEAGIDRRKVYITNVVKHFNSVQRGRLRIHKKPNAREIAACRPWLDAEIARVRPKVIVCLGATAAQALIGRSFRVSTQRGELMESPLAPLITATVHPSSILRAPDDESRRREMRQFIDDLTKIAQHLPASALTRSGEGAVHDDSGKQRH